MLDVSVCCSVCLPVCLVCLSTLSPPNPHDHRTHNNIIIINNNNTGLPSWLDVDFRVSCPLFALCLMQVRVCQ
jgi:hypothetical protein